MSNAHDRLPKWWDGLLLHALLGGGSALALGIFLASRGAWILLFGVFVVSGIYAAVLLRRPLRRRALFASPFPERWRRILERRSPFYRKLGADGRARFERHVLFVLADYDFEAVEGAALDEEIRLSIAAAAATLGHGLGSWPFSGKRTVLVYPHHFHEDYGLEGAGDHAGMVHGQGPIIVSLPALRSSFASPHDGFNVAYHELAHVLDMDDGLADGAPAGLSATAYAVFLETLERRMKRARRGKGSFLRPYAGESPAETFAVATESFFERPEQMRRADPELYDQLRAYFGLDPDRPE